MHTANRFVSNLASEVTGRELGSFPTPVCPNIYLSQVHGFQSNASLVSVVVYYFIQIIRFMLRSYDNLQVEIYTWEINMTGQS
jgi:hypothetical protein